MAKSTYTRGDIPPPLFPEHQDYSVDGDSYFFGTLAVDSEGEYAVDSDGAYAVSIDDDSEWHRVDNTGALIETDASSDIISTITMCDICGTIFDNHWKPTTRGRRKVCRLCLDKDA